MTPALYKVQKFLPFGNSKQSSFFWDPPYAQGSEYRERLEVVDWELQHQIEINLFIPCIYFNKYRFSESTANISTYL